MTTAHRPFVRESGTIEMPAGMKRIVLCSLDCRVPFHGEMRVGPLVLREQRACPAFRERS